MEKFLKLLVWHLETIDGQAGSATKVITTLMAEQRWNFSLKIKQDELRK